MLANRVWQGLLALSVAGLAAACATEPATVAAVPAAAPAAASTPEMVADGAALFGGSGRCSVCHGDGAVGGRFGPDLTDEEWAWIDPSSGSAMADLVELIRSGVTEPRISDTGMPAMGGGNLSDDQLNALAAYILSL